MMEFLSSLGLFGTVVVALVVLILANLRGVIRARNPRHVDREAREAGRTEPYAGVGTKSFIDPADPGDPRG